MMMNGLCGLAPGSTVAVLTFVGSFCPVTTAHVQCVVEARRLIMGEETAFAPPLPRPAKLEIPDAIIGFISLNSDNYVRSKLQGKGEPFICLADRRRLFDMAIRDMDDWLRTDENAYRAAKKVQAAFPLLRFVHYELDGADIALRDRKWSLARADRRLIAMGRPSETAKLVSKMMQRGSSSLDYELGHFIVGPEMPDISSTAVRTAFRCGDMEALQTMLHPAVLEWNIRCGPYMRGAGGCGGGGGEGGRYGDVRGEGWRNT